MSSPAADIPQSLESKKSWDPLKCVVCAQDGHGLHFGVVSCRPCASFFRRSMVKKRTFTCLRGTHNCNIQQKGNRNGCKACRLQNCLMVGMRHDSRDQKYQPNDDSSLLAEFADAYRTFIDDQQSSLSEYSKTVPNFSEYLRLEQNSFANWLEILSEAVDAFRLMNHPSKMHLLADNFCRLQLLHICYMTLDRFGPISATDRFLMVAVGQVLDRIKLEEWDAEVRQMDEQSENKGLKQSFERIFELVKMFRMLPEKAHKTDFCALMLLTLCESAKGLPGSVVQRAKWESCKEQILSDWHKDLGHRSSSNNAAVMQMARLLCILVELDTIAMAEKKTKPMRNWMEGLQRANFTDHDPDQHPKVPTGIFHSANKESNELRYLVRLVQAHHRIWGAFNDTPDDYFGKFCAFEELFTGPDNLLGMHESFTLHPQHMDERTRETFFRELEHYGAVQKHPMAQKATVVYKLLTVGVAKGMPAFSLLSLKDQVVLARFLFQPINFLLNGFYSAQLGANTWIGKDGLTLIGIYRALPHYRDDPCLMSWAQKSLSHSVEIHHRYPVASLEELALLLGILFANPAVPDLSAHARDVLSREQSRHSGLLLRLLQIRLGPAVGASRFADYMLLVERAFLCAHNFDLMLTYQETFHFRDKMRNLFADGLRHFID